MITKKCYIYTRVSTTIQVDGFSLDAQRDRLLKYAEFQGFEVVGEYSDAGKSGKNVESRVFRIIVVIERDSARLTVSVTIHVINPNMVTFTIVWLKE